MRILFYTYGKVCSTSGGTERTTVSLATALTRIYGCECFSLYEVASKTEKEDCFVAEYHWNAARDKEGSLSALRDIIRKHRIELIIDQGSFIHVRLFKKATEGTGCKVVLAHHFEPGAEVLFYNFKKQLRNLLAAGSLRAKCVGLKNILLFPLFRRKSVKSLRLLYHEAYNEADCVVLLHQSFIPLYQSFGQFHDEKKFRIIPNALSYDEFANEGDIKLKKRQALIVARLDETHKRLSLALQIWKEAKKSHTARMWALHIIGDGPSRTMYQRMVKKEDIPDVLFMGRQDPSNSYMESSIFLMTSRSESWGLTLTEAQQFGVVPIAFNTYESLSEIITDNVDGFVVPEGHVEEYVHRLLQLMQDARQREQMAVNALRDCKRFTKSRIAQSWWNLLKTLKSQQ